MQDPRIRLVAVTALSLASYASVWGALATLAWWAVFFPRDMFRPRALPVMTALAMIAVVSIVVTATGGDGAGYFIRFSAILLVALYAYVSYVPGEILGLSVWLFGQRGFEAGLTAEFCLQSVRVLGEDLSRSFMAINLKKNGTIWKWLVPVTGLLVKLLPGLPSRRICSRSGDTGTGDRCARRFTLPAGICSADLSRFSSDYSLSFLFAIFL
jgi:hypothetical protein